MWTLRSRLTSAELHNRLTIEILVDGILITVCHIFSIEQHLLSFIWRENSISEDILIMKCLIIDLKLACNMGMLIISCPWALFEYKFSVTFSKSFLFDVIFDQDLLVLRCITDRISLPSFTTEHRLGIKYFGLLL